jgi:hypothetical protein
MVWSAIFKKERLPLVFIVIGVKINKEYYKEEVLEKHLLLAARNLYEDDYFCFQWDWAPSHTAEIVQKCCEENLRDFIPKDDWPPTLPDFNPLDFSSWGYMLAQLKNYNYSTLVEIKDVILKIWAAIPDQEMRVSCKVTGFLGPNYLKMSRFFNLIYIWAITEKRGICFLNPGFVFWLLVIFFVEINIQIIRKNKQLPI